MRLLFLEESNFNSTTKILLPNSYDRRSINAKFFLINWKGPLDNQNVIFYYLYFLQLNFSLVIGFQFVLWIKFLRISLSRYFVVNSIPTYISIMGVPPSIKLLFLSLLIHQSLDHFTEQTYYDFEISSGPKELKAFQASLQRGESFCGLGESHRSIIHAFCSCNAQCSFDGG